MTSPPQKVIPTIPGSKARRFQQKLICLELLWPEELHLAREPEELLGGFDKGYKLGLRVYERRLAVWGIIGAEPQTLNPEPKP